MLFTLLATQAMAFDATDLPVDTSAEAAGESARHPIPPRRRPPPPHRPPPRAPTPSVPAEPDTHFSLNVSALHMALPMAEFTGEFRLAPRASVALIGGIGTYADIPRFDVGAQARGYLSGDFDRGIALGLEARYTNLGVMTRDDNAAAFGPFLAAKYTFDVPLTVDAQAGVSVVNAESYLAISPIVRLGLGWSF